MQEPKQREYGLLSRTRQKFRRGWSCPSIRKWTIRVKHVRTYIYSVKERVSSLDSTMITLLTNCIGTEGVIQTNSDLGVCLSGQIDNLPLWKYEMRHLVWSKERGTNQACSDSKYQRLGVLLHQHDLPAKGTEDRFRDCACAHQPGGRSPRHM